MRRYILYECGDNIRSNVGSKTERTRRDNRDEKHSVRHVPFGHVRDKLCREDVKKTECR